MTHYEVLGVEAGASPGEVRLAFVALARRHHPDRPGGDADRMRAVNEAWAVLGDAARRARYDQALRVAPRPDRADVPPATPSADRDDLLRDLADDRPLGGQVVLPGWLSLLPVAAFASAIGLFGTGVLFGSAPALALAAVAFALSCALFLAAPFVALLSSRRPPGDQARPTGR